MLKLGVISNPYARICRRNPELNPTLRTLVGKNGLFRLTSTVVELREAIREFHRAGVDCVGIVGGDGSINLVIGELMTTYGNADLPKVLVLGGGTANVLALNIGVKGHPARVISDFLSVNNPTGSLAQVSFHSLKINGRVGFIFANGVAARYLQLFYANKGSVHDAGMLLARAAFSGLLPRSVRARFVSDPTLVSLACAQKMALTAEPELGWNPATLSAVFVSTIPKMAFGISLFQQLDPEHPQAELLATSLEDHSLAAQIFRAVARQPLSRTGLVQRLVSEVRVQSSLGAPYTIDGELFDEPEDGVTIELGTRISFCNPLG